MNKNSTLPKGYFDEIYTKNKDPWEFETSDYEKGKYQNTIDALTKKSYRSAFEIGCSIGVLTAMLADRTETLLAVDASEIPLDDARKRLASKPQVEIRRMSVPDEFPEGHFDLIIVSEVGYYLSMEDLVRLQHLLIDHLENSGQLLLVHWLPQVHDYPLTGDQVHDSFQAYASGNGPLKLLLNKRKEKYRLDLFEKTGAVNPDK